MDMQVLLTLEDRDLADVRGGDLLPLGGGGGGDPMGGFGGGMGGLSPSSTGLFSNLNDNQNTASALSTLIGPIKL